MLLTLSGRVTDVNPVQPLKAPPGILFTLSPIFTVVRALQPVKMPDICVQLSALKFTVVRLVQPSKTKFPKRTVDGGIVIESTP